VRFFAVSVVIYVAMTLVIGRDVLRHPATTALHDAGDPLLTAAILHWTTTHVPLTHDWWQFPIYYPTPDVTAFSEHLLGLSVIATPVEWLTDDALVSYNLVALLTYPLCAMAMYALVWRLTRSAPSAFLAGLAYAFAPYRVPQSPHVQMLATFWAPLALLGLHAYVETRRARWLALFGAAWALQGASNGYYLFFFSIFVGLWTMWFVLARSDWRALWRIAVTVMVAALSLAPVLYGYLVIHARNGFARNLEEIRLYSADAAGVFCASELLTFWSWLRVSCKTPETELFPGAALVIVCVIGFVVALRGRPQVSGAPSGGPEPSGGHVWGPPSGGPEPSGGQVWGAPSGGPEPSGGQVWGPPSGGPARIRLLRWPLTVIGVAYVAIGISVILAGPWRFAPAGIRISASSPDRPLLIGLIALLLAAMLSRRIRAWVGRDPVLFFYLTAAVVTWSLALGPTLTVMGQLTGIPGPYALLAQLPGISELRVPARFWGLTVLSLSVVAGITAQHLLAAFAGTLRPVAIALIAAGLLSDSWIGAMPATPVGPSPVPPSTLANRVVMTLPVGDVLDLPATYHAAIGGWTSVNGYSGYHPNYYSALNYSVRFEEDSAFLPFQARTELDVVVSARAPRLIALVEKQPGVRVVGRQNEWTHYRLPRRGRADAGRAAGRRLPIAGVSSECAPDAFRLALDNDPVTRWVCGPTVDEKMFEIDLGNETTIGAVVNGIGRYHDQFPPEMIVETSIDRTTWSPAWSGTLVAQTIRGGIDNPDLLRIVIPFTPREARYVRLRHPAARTDYYGTIAELDAWSGNTGVPVN
jgi:hypothetical protein